MDKSATIKRYRKIIDWLRARIDELQAQLREDDPYHSENCIGFHCHRCGHCEEPGDNGCICYAR